jgi:LacI family transcriptional regulator, gluconate utilization system Gnt-I transcriptional repressor
MDDRTTGKPVERPRIEEVAARARTSPITVSRALRQPGKVAPQTLARILAAVDALGYVPNASASSLASRRSGILAVLVPTIGNSIFSETVRGVADAVGDADLHLLIGDYGYSDDKERRLVRALIGRQPDALVVIGAVHDAAMRDALRRLGSPVVETWELSDDPVDAVVGFSNFDAGAAVARHFVARGRQRCAFVGGSESRATARRTGFTAALTSAGAAPPEIATTTDISIGTGRRALGDILARAPAIDAVFFATDVLAVGGLLECRDRGIAVPERMALVGLGNLEIGRELQPALTTIEVPAHEMGRRAGQLILARLAGEQAAVRIVDLGFSLLARGTT